MKWNIHFRHQLRQCMFHRGNPRMKVRCMKRHGNVNTVWRTIQHRQNDVIHAVNTDILVLHSQMNQQTHQISKNKMIPQKYLTPINQLASTSAQRQ
jgi:hypothetical protein